MYKVALLILFLYLQKNFKTRASEALPASFLHVTGVATWQKRTQFVECCGILGGPIEVCMCLNIALANVAATFSHCLFYSFFFRRRDFSLHLEATKQSTVWTVIDRVRVYLYFCVCASLHRNFYILNLNLSIHQNRMYI